MSVSVLVVDDVELFRIGLSAGLEQEGFNVLGQASDAEAAVHAARHLQPDLVVLDITRAAFSIL